MTMTYVTLSELRARMVEIAHCAAAGRARGNTLIVAALLAAVFAGSIPKCARADSDGLLTKVQGLFKESLSPDKVLSAYLDAQKSGDFATAYDLLSTADRAFRSKDEYQTDQGKGFVVLGPLAQAMSFTIKSVDVQGLKASAVVENTHPNIMAILGPMMAIALMGGREDEKEKAKTTLADKLVSGNVPTETTSMTETLIKEADGWRIYEGLQVKSAAARLLEEGERLAHAKEYAAAEDRFRQVTEIPAGAVKEEHDKAVQELADARARNDQEQRKQSYLANIKVYDLKTGRYDTFTDKGVPGVTFKIKNAGDLTLKRVEVTVYFKDAGGNTIHEEKFAPINDSSFSFDSNHGPLKPGYIWSIEQGKFFTAKSVPSEWKVGTADAKITDIEFAQ